MKSVYAKFAGIVGVLTLSLSVFAQQSSGPTLPPAELAKQQTERTTQQPYNNQPVWSNARGATSGYTSIPGPEAGVLIQDGGQTWRALKNGTVSVYGGWALVAMMLVIGGFYAWKGTIQLHESPTGRMVERFTLLERMAHWSTAISFSVLAISGLILAFGKNILIPVFGFHLFSWLATIAKTLHNFIGPLFIISCVITFVVFLRDNWPKAVDFKWVASFGGLLSGKHVPSEKFNAGEKIWFWGGLMVLGIVVGASGLVLNFPNFGQTRATMQLASLIHLGGSILFMVGALGHIYMGTLGMAGAFNAMKTGSVDEAWAKEHHEIWLNDIKAGKIPAVRSKTHAQPQPVGGDD
ncbi:MAG: formate dehydrogenase subunit gamma [Betaproteobacteria bacterium]|nr:MAG: formate dehydrogenase subunit gamma [Betaproteobacteria bacterium]TAG45203.1 MAG: formate dehydrogenase subunit gamma [Betaproteobacteria bacterium]